MLDFIPTFVSWWTESPLLASAVVLCVKASGILLLTAFVALTLRHLSAAKRHLLWAAGIVAAVILPFATLSLPSWRVPVRYVVSAPASPAAAPAASGLPLGTPPRADMTPRADIAPIAPEASVTGAAPTISVATPVGTVQATLGSRRPLWTPGTIGIVWLLGALASIWPLLAGVTARAKLENEATDLLPGPWERAVRSLRADGLVPSRVRIMASTDCETPMTWGFVRPIVLLPMHTTWHEDERRNALLHELAHVRRGDYVTKLVSRVLCTIYWFNPVAWIAARAERLAREQACDDAVLLTGSRPSLYAQQLLDVAYSTPSVMAVAALPMARRSNLSHRLRAILDGAHDRSPIGRRLAALTVGTVCAVVPPIATLTPDWVGSVKDMPNEQTEAPKATPPAPVQQLGLVQLMNGQQPAVLVTTQTPGQQQGVCVPAGRKPAASITVHDGSSNSTKILRVKWDNGTCRIELNARGEFTLSPNADDVVTLSSRGFFEVEQDDGRTERRVRLERDGSEITRTYWVDRRQVPWNAEAAEWFAQTIVTLDRRTAFAVDTRLPLLLRRGGVDAVLAEVALMQSTYPQRVYYTKLIEVQRLTPQQLAQVLEAASRNFDSGYEKTELLLTVAKQPAFGDQLHLAYAQMAKGIASDYEKRRALSALLSRSDLKPEVVRSMLEATEGMKSDYELAELLIGIERRYAIDANTRPYYVRALSTIQSDYEQRRVLSTVTKNGGLSAGITHEIIAVAGRSMKGYELAEYLIEVASKGTLDQAASTEFFAATKNVGSDYERKRVLETLLKKGDLSRTVQEGILTSAATIESDYECAELLIAFARAVKVDDTLRPAYEKAAATIKSDYEYGRAMSAVRRFAERQN